MRNGGGSRQERNRVLVTAGARAYVRLFSVAGVWLKMCIQCTDSELSLLS